MHRQCSHCCYKLPGNPGRDFAPVSERRLARASESSESSATSESAPGRSERLSAPAPICRMRSRALTPLVAATSLPFSAVPCGGSWAAVSRCSFTSLARGAAQRARPGLRQRRHGVFTSGGSRRAVSLRLLTRRAAACVSLRTRSGVCLPFSQPPRRSRIHRHVSERRGFLSWTPGFLRWSVWLRGCSH